MNPEPPRSSTRLRRTVAGAVAMVAVGAVAVVWLVAGDEPRPTTTLVAPATAPVIEEPRLALAAAPAASAAEDVRVESPGEVQMCGGAWVKLKDDGDVDWDSVAAASRESSDALAASVASAMASSADEHARAAALVIALPASLPLRVKPPSCDGDAACERELKVAQEWVERRDALAKLAQDSSDPTVYSWAVQACSVANKDEAGNCQLISPAQWARLDPSNAAPWIAVAMKARAEKDAAALDDALFRISVAERYDPGEYEVSRVLLDHVPDSESNLWGALMLVVQGLAFNSSAAAGDLQALAMLCAAKDLTPEDARREACERSAEMLLKSSTTLNGLVAGRMIGKRVGWPQERIDRLQKESGALQTARTRASPTGAESVGCKAVRAQLDNAREFAAEGVVAALRRRASEAPVRTVASTSLRSATPGSVPPR